MSTIKKYLVLEVSLYCLLILPTQLLASTTLSENSIVYYFDREGQIVLKRQDSTYYRKLLKINIDGSLLIQDFYSASDKKQIDPIVMKDPAELNTFTNNQSLEGSYTQWYETGQKEAQANFVNGLIEGKLIIWHENGQQAVKGFYKKGVLDGTLKLWFDNGQLQFENQFKHNKLDGSANEWYSNGKLASHCEYQLDVLLKPCEKWDEMGKVLQIKSNN